MFLSVHKFLLEGGGQDAGKLELVKTSVEKAIAFTNKLKPGFLPKEIPSFEENYERVKNIAKTGKTKRKDMPVITSSDVKAFQAALKTGSIDIEKPFSGKTNPKDVFPNGLSAKDSENFLDQGLEVNDGDKMDDVVKVARKRLAAGDLKPIQKQIYFDKSIEVIVKNGVEKSFNFLSENSILIVSSDNRIIDGHHRWLSANLLDPKMKITCLVIDLPISKLLPLATTYGDVIGNKRNA